MASIVLVGLVAAVVVLSRWRESFAIGLVVGLPIFFNWDGSRLDYGHSVIIPDPGATLPLATFVAPFLVPAVWRGVRQPLSADPWLRRLDLGAVAIGIWIVIATLAGYASSKHPAPEIVAQTISPLWFYAIARGWREREQVAAALRGFLVATTATAAFILVSNAIDYQAPPIEKEGVQLSDLVFGPFDIYQLWDYVPMLYAIAALFALALALCGVARVWTGVSALILTASVMLMHSRGSLMALMVGIAVVVVALGLQRRVRLAPLAAAVVTFAVMFVGFGAADVAAPNRVLATVLPDSLVLSSDVTGESSIVTTPPPPAPEPEPKQKTKPKKKNKAKPKPKPAAPKPKTFIDVSNDERIQRAEEAIDVVKGNPLFGSRLAGSIEDDSGVSRTTLAHNQYLDYANRGGLPLVILFVLTALIAAWHYVTRLRRSVLVVAGTATLVALLVVGNLTQVNFIQPITAYPLWLILGAAHLAAADGRSRAAREAEA